MKQHVRDGVEVTEVVVYMWDALCGVEAAHAMNYGGHAELARVADVAREHFPHLLVAAAEHRSSQLSLQQQQDESRQDLTAAVRDFFLNFDWEKLVEVGFTLGFLCALCCVLLIVEHALCARSACAGLLPGASRGSKSGTEMCGSLMTEQDGLASEYGWLRFARTSDQAGPCLQNVCIGGVLQDCHERFDFVRMNVVLEEPILLHLCSLQTLSVPQRLYLQTAQEALRTYRACAGSVPRPSEASNCALWMLFQVVVRDASYWLSMTEVALMAKLMEQSVCIFVVDDNGVLQLRATNVVSGQRAAAWLLCRP